MERYYTVAEVSAITHIPKRTLYDAIDAGKLVATLPNGTRRGMRVSESAVRAWLEKSTTRRG